MCSVTKHRTRAKMVSLHTELSDKRTFSTTRTGMTGHAQNPQKHYSSLVSWLHNACECKQKQADSIPTHGVHFFLEYIRLPLLLSGRRGAPRGSTLRARSSRPSVLRLAVASSLQRGAGLLSAPRSLLWRSSRSFSSTSRATSRPSRSRACLHLCSGLLLIKALHSAYVINNTIHK